MNNNGFTANLKPAIDSTLKPTPKRDKQLLAMIVVAMMAVGFASVTIISEQIKTSPAPLPVGGIQSFNITKYLSIGNQWGATFYKSPSFFGGKPNNWTIGTLDAIHQAGITSVTWKQNTTTNQWYPVYTTTGDFYFITAQLIAFNYTNNAPPITFTDARLILPLDMCGGWASPMNGKDVGHAIDRAFSISLYEIKSPWKNWGITKTQTDGATWQMIRDGKIMVNKNPSSTITGLTSNTTGNLSFSIKGAINDWKNGTWNPANGFLVAMLAPWETTNYSWFASNGYKTIQESVHFKMKQSKLIIAKNVVIPEFDIILPIFTLMIAIVGGKIYIRRET